MHPGKQLDEQIRMHLCALSYAIENANERNLQDMNIYSEGTVCGLLNMVWGINLVDANKYIEKNHPAIDLVDDASKTYVQVTSDKSLDKIRETITKSSAKYGPDATPKIFLLKFRKPSRKLVITLDDDLTFSNDDIIDMNTLCHLIQDIDVIDLKRSIADYIKERIPIEPDLNTYSIEVFNLRILFKTLSEIDGTDKTAQDEPEVSELAKKKQKYLEFWSAIETQYRSVVDLQREKAFKAAFDRFDQANRERLRQYLRYESNKLLFDSGSGNPNAIIEALRDKIKLDINMPLISTMELTHFLYYQFYRCNVLPIFEEDL